MWPLIRETIDFSRLYLYNETEDFLGGIAMKKTIVAILLMLTIFSVGIAEGIDLSGMTDQELIDLRDRIDGELSNRNTTGYSRWYDYGIGMYLPNMEEVLGRELGTNLNFRANLDNYFSAGIDNTHDGDYDAICDACIAFGFTNVIERSIVSFSAKDESGHKLDIYGFSSFVEIRLE